MSLRPDTPPKAPNPQTSCGCDETQIRRRRQSNGVAIYVRQCLRCGRNCGAVAKDSPSVMALAEIPEWDEALRVNWRRRRDEEIEARRAEWQSRIVGSPDWWKRYNGYLSTPE